MKIGIVGETSSLHHWVLSRLLKRSGLSPDLFTKISLESGDDYSQCDGYIVLGEAGLSALLNETGVERWMNRIVPYQSKPCLPLAHPNRLLPFLGGGEDDDDELGDLDKKFRSPSRYFGIINQQLHQLVASVQGTREWRAVPYEQRLYSWDDLNAFRAFVKDVEANPTLLSSDIETAYEEYSMLSEEERERFMDKDTILRISFATREYEAYSVPFSGEFLELATQLLVNPSIPKLFHNGFGFDLNMLEKQNGIVVQGLVVDSMDIAHVIQPDLDKNLESISGWMTREYPWKHLSKLNEQLYSCIDADVALRCWNSGKAYLSRHGMWDNFERHFIKTRKYMHIAHRNGVPLDTVYREELSHEYREISKNITIAIQDMVPQSLKKRKLYHRQMDETMQPIDGVGTERFCSACGQVNISTAHKCVREFGATIKTRDKVQTFFYRPQPENPTYDELKKWLKDNGFNPNSGDQVKAYIKANHHPLSKNWKTQNDSADTRHLETLSKTYGKDHPVYAQLVESRKVNKAISSFIDGWTPDENGKITTILGNGPMSLRLNSKSVNLQQAAVRESNPYAAKARKMIRAPKGHKIVGIDSTAIEAVLTGFYMGDPDYIQAAYDDIHSFVVARHLGWDWQGKETAKKIKADFNKLRDEFKRVNHALNYGASPYLIHKTNPETFPTVADAKRTVDSIYANLPKLKGWHDALRETAKEQAYLENCYGYRFYFYDVYTYKVDDYGRLIVDADGQPVVVPGKDKNRIYAILPQSTAAVFMRDSIWMVGERVPEEWIPAIYTVHDATYLIVPEADVDRAKAILADVFGRTVPELGGLSIGYELSIGDNWLDMEKC